MTLEDGGADARKGGPSLGVTSTAAPSSPGAPSEAVVQGARTEGTA